MWKALHEGSIENLTMKAVGVFEQAMEQTEDGRLAFDAAKAILNDQGYLAERSSNEVTGPGRDHAPFAIREIVVNHPPDVDEATAAVEPLDGVYPLEGAP